MRKKPRRATRAKKHGGRAGAEGLRRREQRAVVGPGSAPPPLFAMRPCYRAVPRGEPSVDLVAGLRRLDVPYSEFEEHQFGVPADWRGVLDLPEPARSLEFVRRARALVRAGDTSLEQQACKFAKEGNTGASALCGILVQFDARRLEIRVRSPDEPALAPDSSTAAGWSAAAERYVLDLVREHGGVFRVPPPEGGGWLYPKSTWARTPDWPARERPEWHYLAETVLRQIDLAREADASGWTERARHHERCAVEGVIKLRAFDDARAGRLSSMGRKTTLTPVEEVAIVDECRTRKANGEKLSNVEREIARRHKVSVRMIRGLRQKYGTTRAKGAKPQ